MPYTQEDIDELRAKIKTFAGVRSSSFADQTTTFDPEAAERLLATMEREVNGARSRTRYAGVRKGV